MSDPVYGTMSLAALIAAEWSGEGGAWEWPSCPACGGYKPDGDPPAGMVGRVGFDHDSACTLDKALTAARTLPPCCIPTDGASLAERLFCVYNAGGPPDRAGLAWDGRPVPAWAELPADSPVRAKWEADAQFVEELIESAVEQAITVTRSHPFEIPGRAAVARVQALGEHPADVAATIPGRVIR